MIAKKDLNQPDIEAALGDVGAAVLSVHQVKEAFDMVVGFRGQLYLMEVKNPEYRPKRKLAESMLTSGEAKCKATFEAVGCRYHIVFSADEALKVIGAIEWNKQPTPTRHDMR